MSAYKVLSKGNVGTALQVASNDWDLVILAFQGQTSGIPQWEMRSLNGVLFADDVLRFETPSGNKEIHLRTSAQATDVNLKVPSLTAGDNVLVIDSIENDFLERNVFHKDISFAQTATPSAPPAGEIVVWMDNDTQLKMMDSDGNIFIFGSASVGEPNTTSTVGTGEGTLTKPKVVFDLPFKSIKAGTNITITNNADDVTIAAAALVPGLHSAQHAVGGGDPFVKGNDLAAAARYLEDVADPASDAQRIWITDGGVNIKYWSDEGSPVKYSLPVLEATNTFTAEQIINGSPANLLRLRRSSSTINDGIEFVLQGLDSAANITDYGKIRVVMIDTVDPSEDSAMRFQVRIAGSLQTVGAFNEVGDLLIGDDQRLRLAETGLSAQRIFTFPNADSLLFGSGVDNNLGDHYLDVGDIATPANPSAGIRRIFLDSASGKLSVRTSAGVTVSLEEQPGAAGAHKANHVVGGSDPFAKNDNLAAAARYLEDVADPTSDSQRIWLVDGSNLIKYWSDEGSPVKHVVAVQGLDNAFTVDQSFGNILLTGYEDYTETAAPGSPAANHGRVFFDTTDEHLKIKKSSGTVVDLESGGGGGGDNITVNTVAATDADFDDTTPAAVAGGVNVKWQKDAGTPNNISAYVAADAVANTVLANMAANTIKGNNTGSTGDPVDISVGTNTVLGRVGSNIVAAQLVDAQITTATISLGKLANIATDSLIGRDTAASGAPENILLNATLEFDGSLNLRRAALTGDVTASAGSNATTIANNAVSNAKLADMAGFSVKLKSTTGTGDPEDFAVGTNTVLGRVAGDIVAAQLATGQVANNAIDNTKLADMAGFTVRAKPNTGSGDPTDVSMAADTVLGRSGSGDIDDIQIATNHLSTDAVTDAKIATHTSTKITITAKGQLNTNIFYEDEDNSVGAHYLQFDDIADPTAPAAGKLRLYSDNSDNHLKVIKNGGTIVDLESGGGGGSENTSASNLGSGEGVFKAEVGDDLQFRSLTATSSKITLANNTNDIGIDVAEANLTLSNIGGTIAIGQISNGLITLAKLANIATDSLIGRDTAASGVPENILLNSTLEMDGSGNLRRAALTGDVTASAGSNTTAIGAGVIVDADINASGITTRSKLPSAIVYDDELNTISEDTTFRGTTTPQVPIRIERITSTVGNSVVIRANMRDDAANLQTYGNFVVEIADSVNGSEDGLVRLQTAKDGTNSTVLTLDKDGILTLGLNQRLIQSESGLTAARTITFKDATYQVAGVNLDNLFSEPQTIKKNTEVLETLFRDSGTANDAISLHLDAKNSGGTQKTAGGIQAYLYDVTPGAEKGSFNFQVMKSGSLTSVVGIDESGFYFGETNFRGGLSDAGLTAFRVHTFPDASCQLAGQDFANIFTEDQTVRKNTAALFKLHRPSNTVTDGVEFTLDLNDSGGTETAYAKLRAVIINNTDPTESGALRLQSRVAGSLTTGLEITEVANVDITRGLVLSGIISPAQLTADTNDWNPTDLQTSTIIRVDTDSSMRNLTGITAPSPDTAKVLTLRNISTNTLLLMNQNTGSSAANRFDFNGYDLPLMPKTEMELKYDTTLDRWICANLTNLIIPPINLGFYHRRDMAGNASDEQMVSVVPSGGTLAAIAGEQRHPGIFRVTLGTNTTGTGGWISTSNNEMLGNSQYQRLDFYVIIDSLSNGTNTYSWRCGFIDTSGFGDPTDGAFFRYTHSVNSGKFQRVTRNNTTETATDTGTTVAVATWYKLSIIVNPAGTNVEFFINDVSVGSNTTNIPITANSRLTGFGLGFVKSAGTTNNNAFQFDAMEHITYFPTVR